MIGLKTLTSLCHQLQKNNSDLLAHIFLRFVSPALSFGIGYSQGLPCIEFGFVTLNRKMLKHGAILHNEAEVFSLSITNPNGRPMLPFDWLIHSSLILAKCHRILFLCRFSAVEK